MRIGARTALLASVIMVLAVAGCGRHRCEKEAAAFGRACGQAGFTVKQCAFLYVMHLDAKNDADDSSALAAAGLAVATSNAALNAYRR